MSLFSFIFKRKKSMAKPYTKRIKLNKYTLTSHAQNKIVSKKHHMSKYDVIDDMYRKELYNTRPNVYKYDGSLEYKRIGRRLTSVIALKTKNIKTLWKNDSDGNGTYRNLPKEARPYVYRKLKLIKRPKK